MRLKQRTGSHLRNGPDGLQLIATRGSGDAPLQFPPQSFVHGNEVVEEVPIGPLGVLYTYSVVHPGRDKVPYGLAMVDFAPGVRVFGRLRQCFFGELGESSEIGDANSRDQGARH